MMKKIYTVYIPRIKNCSSTYIRNRIVKAINEFYNCGDEVVNILKAATDSVLSGTNGSEMQHIEQRLKEIDNARNDFVNLIVTGT